MIRPAARAALWRWREVLAGAALAALGAWWAFFTGGGPLHWVGYVVLTAGAALALAGIQRGRFRHGAGGPGVVQIVEGQVAYFGPLTGGTVALSEMAALSLDGRSRPPHWVLAVPGQGALAIPVNAEGAEALFDAFATLPGLRTERMLAALGAPAPDRIVIWQSAAQAAQLRRLH